MGTCPGTVLTYIITAISGTVVGFLSAVLIELAKHHTRKHRLRKTLYREVTSNYFEVKLFRQRLMMPDENRLISDPLRDLVSSQRYHYALTQIHVLDDLEELGCIEEIYRTLRRATELPMTTLPMTTLGYVNAAISVVEDAIKNNKLDSQILTEVCPRWMRDEFKQMAYRAD